VRTEHQLIADIVRHGRLILDLIDDLDEAASGSASATAGPQPAGHRASHGGVSSPS
jgi:hypothetical protein